MTDLTNFYINGSWISPSGTDVLDVINPATEEPVGRISLGSTADVDAAVTAARAAFPAWSSTTVAERKAALERLTDVYRTRSEEMAVAISTEMGAPISMSTRAQVGAGLGHLMSFIAAIEEVEWTEVPDPESPEHQLLREPIGVAALITPWNWPMNQVVLKVGAALAAGCTMVLKPSEIAPLSSMLFAEFVDAAELPAGVFNLVNGDGATAGSALTSHPEVDVISFTGSTRAGRLISQAAAENITRISLELGGKSPNLVFADADLEKAIRSGVGSVMLNTGQSCNAPTRMLVERTVYDDAVVLAAEAAEATQVGDPAEEGRHIGPLSSAVQFDKVQALIQEGVDEGARLVAGGPGRPEGLETGYYARPTVFADVNNDMTIAREEIFGPVLVMIPFDTEEEAIEIANDTPYGLAAFVQTGDSERARRVTRQLQSGMVQVNGTHRAPGAPFGGYKQSGIGREGGPMGIEEFLEVKAVSGMPVG
jgi:aldehyde dehydrogenase (NAD+)